MILSDFSAEKGEWALVVAGASFVFAALLTAWLIHVLLKRKLLDIPNQRSNHSQPTPRGGGLAIVVLCFAALIHSGAWLLAGAVLALAMVSLVDDMRPLPARVRFVAQLLAVGAVLFAMPAFSVTGMLPSFVEKMVIGFCWLWFINLFNFMDGANGLAGSESAFLAGGVALLLGDAAESELPVLFMLCGSSLGFLVWNWHPAKVFMGDVGSIPTGFLLGYFLIALVLRGYAPAALILPAYFVADATFTLLHRAWKGESLATAHSSHCYQRAIRRGMGHNVMVKWVCALNMLLLLLAILSINSPSAMAWGAVIAAYSGAFACMAFFAGIGRRKVPRNIT